MNVVRLTDGIAIVPSMVVAVERDRWGDTRQQHVERGALYIVTPFGQRVDVLLDAPADEVDDLYERVVSAIEQEGES